MMRELWPLDHVEGGESVPSRRCTWSRRWEWRRVVGNEAPGQIRIFVVKGQEFGFILSVMGVWGKVAGDASAGNGLI